MTSTIRTENEYVCALRVLAHVAQMPGILSEAERLALRTSWQELPIAPALDDMVFKPSSLSDHLGEVQSPDVRGTLYHAACLLLEKDGVPALLAEEVLFRLRHELKAGHPEPEYVRRIEKYAERLTGAACGDLIRSAPKGEGLPATRTDRAREASLRYGAVVAAMGSFPFPAADRVLGVATVNLQARLFRDIKSLLHGECTNAQAAELLAELGAALPARAAFIAVMKFIPVWGRDVAQIVGFATTYAVGMTACEYFARKEAAEPARLRATFLENLLQAQGGRWKPGARWEDTLRLHHDWLRRFFEQTGGS